MATLALHGQNHGGIVQPSGQQLRRSQEGGWLRMLCRDSGTAQGYLGGKGDDAESGFAVLWVDAAVTVQQDEPAR